MKFETGDLISLKFFNSHLVIIKDNYYVISGYNFYFDTINNDEDFKLVTDIFRNEFNNGV